MKWYQYIYMFLMFFALAACSGSDDEAKAKGQGGENACVNMCTEANFTSGTEMDFTPVIECQCSGAGDGLSQSQCTTYCADFDIDENNSFLTTEESSNDKCVCDGTGG